MKDKERKAMADRIKERRESLGYTQEGFAEIVDLSPSSYVKIENAFQKPGLDSLIRIAGKLDTSLDYLVFGGKKKKKPDDTEIMRAILESVDAEKLEHTKDLLVKIIKATER